MIKEIKREEYKKLTAFSYYLLSIIGELDKYCFKNSNVSMQYSMIKELFDYDDNYDIFSDMRLSILDIMKKL